MFRRRHTTTPYALTHCFSLPSAGHARPREVSLALGAAELPPVWNQQLGRCWRTAMSSDTR